MVKNYITKDMLKKGELTKGHIVVLYNDGTLQAFEGKITKIIRSGEDIILKMRTGKGYPLGHKFVFRSLEEII